MKRIIVIAVAVVLTSCHGSSPKHKSSVSVVLSTPPSDYVEMINGDTVIYGSRDRIIKFLIVQNAKLQERFDITEKYVIASSACPVQPLLVDSLLAKAAKLNDWTVSQCK